MRWVSGVVVLAAAIVLAVGFVAPGVIRGEVGLLLLVVAVLVALTGHYLAASPIPVRGGAVLRKSTHPIAYRLWFVAALALFGLIVVVLARSYIAA
jgi:hypothetical protein